MKHGRKRTKRSKTPMAEKADRHTLYQQAVQNVEAEIDFVDATFKEIRGRKARRLREDFCGTANTSCEWVRRRPDNEAVGIDLDQPTLDWGMEHNVETLKDSRQKHVQLINCDVRTPPAVARGVDIVLAMNFSYYIFATRAELRAYFESVRRSLGKDGVFFLDFYGGYEAFCEQDEERDIDGKFTYVWDQASYNPISGRVECHIHFKFKDGSKLKKAFSYTWRVWTMPEIRELLAEAGFKKTTVYCEGTDEDGEGDGEFEATEICDADASFIAYIAAEL
jgi:SAM-dependent methyltransferase